MQHHQIQPRNKRSSKKRVGRGGKRGTYSGRGLKGQKSRAGRRIRPAMRDIIKKLPKRRGHKSTGPDNIVITVNVGQISGIFQDNEIVNPTFLRERGIIRFRGKKIPKVKILANGKLEKKLHIQTCEVSEAAGKKITKVGGDIK